MKFKNRSYYGEYTLEHWGELILRKDIILPEYQRSFVWDKERSTNLIHSIVNGEFVPPVTIGIYQKDDSSRYNLIIDGQQRLTSLLLAYAKCYPIKRLFKEVDEIIDVGDTDDEQNDEIEPQGNIHAAPEDEGNLQKSVIVEWTFNKLLSLGCNINEIRSAVHTDEKYEEFTPINDFDNFFKQNYLGFTLLVPESNSRNQERFYSSVFKSINSRGVPLDALEVRRAQYFLSPNLPKFFEPNACKDIKINAIKNYKLDFVRYLYWLWTYIKEQKRIRRVAVGMRYKGSKPNVEDYYSSFIDDIVKQYNAPDADNTQFKTLFPNKDYSHKFSLLTDGIVKLGLTTKIFDSIIDADIYCFGLIYVTVFEGKHLKEAKIAALTTELVAKIDSLKGDDKYKKDPNTITRTRERVEQSIVIFESHAE